MKKILIIGLSLIFALTSCEKDEPEVIKVDKVTIDHESISIVKEESFQLNTTILPENAVNKTLKWESTDESIAIVDDNGLVTALEVGETIITAYSSNNIQAACVVTVKPISYAMPIISKDKVKVKEFLLTLTSEVEEIEKAGYYKISCTPDISEANMFSNISYEFRYDGFSFKELNFTYKLDESLNIGDGDISKLNTHIVNSIILLK